MHVFRRWKPTVLLLSSDIESSTHLCNWRAIFAEAQWDPNDCYEVESKPGCHVRFAMSGLWRIQKWYRFCSVKMISGDTYENDVGRIQFSKAALFEFEFRPFSQEKQEVVFLWDLYESFQNFRLIENLQRMPHVLNKPVKLRQKDKYQESYWTIFRSNHS